MAKKNAKIKQKIEAIFREEGKPMTTQQIIDKLVDARWKNLPSRYAISNIMRQKPFTRIGTTDCMYLRSMSTKPVSVWYLKEELA